jgi:hypothetical protein
MIADEVGRIAMSSSLGESIKRAAGYTRAQGHPEVTLEHMLLALAEDPDAGLVLAASNVDVSRLVTDVSGFLGRLEDRSAAGSDAEPAVSSALLRILEAAAAAAKGGHRREINGAIVLAAIVGDGKSPAAHILRSQGLTFEDAILAIQRGAGAPPTAQSGLGGAKIDDSPASESEPVGGANHGQAPPQVEPPVSYEAKSGEEAGAAVEEAPAPVVEPSGQSEKDEDSAVATASSDAADMSETPREAEPSSSIDMPSSAPFPPPLPVPAAPPERAAQPSWMPPPAPAGAPPSQPGPAGPEPTPPAAAPAAERPGPPPLAPWPEARGPREAAPRRQASVVPRKDNAGRAATGQRSRAGTAAEIGQLVENIPRNMRVAIPVLVEVRIARRDVKALSEGLQGGGAAYRHEVTITNAMSVRLRAPDGGFFIENASPETQWIEKTLLLSSDEFASWRWNVTPREKGKKRLQLIISARTVSGDGLAAETALPDQVITVRVRTNFTRSVTRWVGWAVAALIGGLLARFGEGAYDAGLQAFAKFMAS